MEVHSADDWDLETDTESVLRFLVESARETTRRHRMPTDMASDIAQEAFTRLWEAAGDGKRAATKEAAARLVEQVASATRQRRRREGKRLARGRPSADTIPSPTCPRLSLLGPFADSPRDYRTALHAATVFVAHTKGVLRAGQLRLFGLMHATGGNLDALLGRLDVIVSRKALQKRIRRLRRRIERHVVALLEREVPAAEWARVAGLTLGPGSLRKRLKSTPDSELRRISGIVMHALRGVIH